MVQMVEIILKKVSPLLYQALGIFLPLITTNCAVLGVILSVLAALGGVVYMLYGEQINLYIAQQLQQQKETPASKPEEDARTLYLDTPHTRGKIHPMTGDYETFGGITCIAPVADRYTNPGWAHVYNFIESDPALSKYYTPLPVSSYHMTIHPMFTVSAVPGSTPRRFDKELLRAKDAFTAFYNETVEHPFEPRGGISDTYAQGIIVIAVDLREEDSSRAFGLRKLIQRLTGLNAIDEYRQHITLAYRKRSFDSSDIGSIQQSLKTIKSILADEVLANSNGQLVFDKAELMLFHDMALFQPTNPMTWTDEPLADLPPTPAELKMKVKPEGWRAPWL